MQKILGYLRRAVQEFDLIENGDRIAVGISGGKDSLVLLTALVSSGRLYAGRYHARPAVQRRADRLFTGRCVL